VFKWGPCANSSTCVLVYMYFLVSTFASEVCNKYSLGRYLRVSITQRPQRPGPRNQVFMQARAGEALVRAEMQARLRKWLASVGIIEADRWRLLLVAC
jgi:hypothetical protein